MRTSYDLTKVIATTAYQDTMPFPRPISKKQLRHYLLVTNSCWLVGLVVVCYLTVAIAKFAWTQRAERIAEAELRLTLQTEIARLAQLHSYTAAQTMELAKNIQSVIDTADSSSQKRFLVAILPEALRLQTLYRIPVSATIGQAIYESHYGTSGLAKVAHNYFGLKAGGSEWSGDSIEMPTKDLGQRTIARFRSFPDMKSGIEGYATFLRSKDRYKAAFDIREGPKFVETVAKAGYCPDSNYTSAVTNIINRHKLAVLDLPQELPAPPENSAPHLAVQPSELQVDGLHPESLTPMNPTPALETARN